MARRVFYSFHYDSDNWRVQTVRNIRAIEAQPKLTSNEWETVWRQGKKAIENWIAAQMTGKSCVVVLIGTQTASRPWVKHEIIKGWNDGKGILGIHIHKLRNSKREQAVKGENPFEVISLPDGSRLSRYIDVYDPPYSNSADVYDYIAKHIETWTETAVAARGR